ncbi:MurR/RpiR family transcriptional regulator [Paenibacillus pini]|uniref:Transcriptional regulator n=1 Tax=Paenibacillus pini JCM 16418 TaxID=1236976 RepID=W7Z0N4_9BACL|nr:MurR/RpiR family transcriptional regulator [Paenibacillus pini]GAF10541.1 transcriptional regulator [Paenibacillus pini JCM 16418]
MNGGLVRLREILDDITPSERKVAEYIISYPHRVLEMSVAQLSGESGGSQAAIIRLCKSMGIKGYSELKLKVAGDLNQNEERYEYREIRSNDSIERIINTVSANNIQSIRDTVTILDPDTVERAVDALSKAKRIYFYGLGASNLIAQDAQHKFLRINKTSHSFTDPHLELSSAVMLSRDDVAVGVSYSGETSHVIECLKEARLCGAKTISITKYGNNSVASNADYPLYTSSTENAIRSGAMSSRMTQLNVIDILYLAVASREYDKSVLYLEKSRDIINRMTGR